LACGVGQRFGEVSGEHFSIEVLADGFGRFSAELFDEQAVLKDFERFLDTPS